MGSGSADSSHKKSAREERRKFSPTVTQARYKVSTDEKSPACQAGLIEDHDMNGERTRNTVIGSIGPILSPNDARANPSEDQLSCCARKTIGASAERWSLWKVNLI